MPDASPLTDENRARLAKVSIATIATALFKIGFRNTVLQDVHPLKDPASVLAAPNMVGEAYTLRYIPSREDLDGIESFKDHGHPQRKGIEECPPGHVFVVDSRQDPRAASAGGILVTRLMVRGCAGFVTDGGLRDSPEIANLNFAAYHNRPSAPTNLIHHHALDLNVPIGCGGVPVFPGDIMVGDAEGVVVIPAHVANDIAEEAHEMTAFEDYVQERVAAGQKIFGLYPPTAEETKTAYAAWRKEKGR